MMNTEFAVIGGSYAGMSAALQLARARRQVLVVDAGQRRNRFVDEAGATAHGFLGQDGRAPAAIAAEARQQLLAYPNVRWIDGLAEDAHHRPDGHFGFRVGGAEVSAARLVLATGVRDEMPPVPGLAERWGRSVFHCPYCHGYELEEGAIGVVATSPAALHQAAMLPDWGPTTLFLNDAFTPSADELALLARRGTQIERTPVARIEGVADVVLTDGRRCAMAGHFAQPRMHMASPVAEELGCAFEQGPLGPFIQVDRMGQTSVPHVFACGDATRAAGNVALAVGDGAMTGAAAHRSVMF
jgi:thioredoxin reductase